MLLGPTHPAISAAGLVSSVGFLFNSAYNKDDNISETPFDIPINSPLEDVATARRLWRFALSGVHTYLKEGGH